MKLEDLTVEAAAEIFIDETAARKFEDEVLYPGPSMVTEDEHAIIVRVLECVTEGKCTSLEVNFRNYIATRQCEISGDFSAYRLAGAKCDGDDDIHRPLEPGRDAPISPEREAVRFVFASDETGPHGFLWRAELEIPPDAKTTDCVELVVKTSDDVPEDGMFKLAGVTLPLVNGMAKLPFGMFLSGMKNSMVERITVDGKVQRGHLIFF